MNTYKRSLKQVFSRFLIKSYANQINTVTQPTGTVLDGGTAVQLTHHVRVVYSREIEFKALPIMMFLQFAQRKTELEVQPGSTIQMMTYNNIKRGGKLQEGIRMKTQGMSSSTKNIVVDENGNAIAFSEKALKTSFTNIMADATTLLARDLAITLDCQIRDVVLAGIVNTIYGRANASAAKISTRSAITTANGLSVATVKDAVEILATNNAPKFSGNYYVCFVHPHQSRTLRDDPAWLEASKYGNPEQLFNGEIGRIDDVRFIETTLMTNGAAAADDEGFDPDLKKGASGSSTTVDVYQALIFGENTYGHAVALPVELRDDGVTDFGREHALAWYGIWGTEVLNPERGVVIETS